ncbi:MAG: DUF6036 family nucleotidyltransferase [Acidimicrobiales bacterium]
MSELIERSQLEEAFRRVAAELKREGIGGDIYIFGGAAMVLAFNAREATRDVDALFEPREKIHRIALSVAQELGMPSWWLNDQASSYLPRRRDEKARLIFDHPHLRVSVVSPEHLLAMKAMAARTYADLDDIATLCTHLEVTEVTDVAALCARIYPEEPLTARARLVIEDVLDRLRQGQ